MDGILQEFVTVRNMVMDVLNRAEIAEEEIARGIETLVALAGDNPAAALPRVELVWGAFDAMKPTPMLEQVAPWVYRAHARELVARLYLKTADLSMPTWAEVAGAMSETSQVAKLGNLGASVYLFALKRVADMLRDDAPPRLLEIITEAEATIREPWEGAAEEEAARLRASGKFRQEWRKAERKRVHPRVFERLGLPNLYQI